MDKTAQLKQLEKRWTKAEEYFETEEFMYSHASYKKDMYDEAYAVLNEIKKLTGEMIKETV